MLTDHIAPPELNSHCHCDITEFREHLASQKKNYVMATKHNLWIHVIQDNEPF